MAREKTPTWERPRITLGPTGPERVGILPDALDPPTRPVNRRAPDGTNKRVLDRPAQGEWKGQDMTIPNPVPFGR